MLKLYCRFCNNLFWVVCLGAAAVPALAASCNTSPVFGFSQALYLEQYTSALELLPRIKRERGSPLAQFLQQVLVFKRAYEQDKPAQQQGALEEIEALITSLSSRPPGKNGENNQLTLANILIHSARLQLAVGNVLRAAHMAKQGKRLLDETLEHSPDTADALLSNGLYFYYTGSENDALGWIMRWWSLEGDKVHGREMMERAVENSADHAFEAARSLVSDVVWNRRDTCRYMPLFNQLGTLQTQSISAVKEQIALALFCGRADSALKQIIVLNGLSEPVGSARSQAHSNWLLEAQLYALAALGDSKRLKTMLATLDPKEDQMRYWQAQFSLAKALDTQGAREKAVSLYSSVLASSFDSPYQELARAYLKRPYQKPRSFKQTPGNRLQFACGGG